MKRINLLAQKLKRTHRQLTGRGFKKAHIKNDISPSIKTRQNADLISSLDHTDLYKKYFIEPINTSPPRTSTRGDSWWFPKMEHLINEMQKSNQRWNDNFNHATESDISLEENRDYGYQSSSASK